jgi:hypothetical protein
MKSQVFHLIGKKFEHPIGQLLQTVFKFETDFQIDRLSATLRSLADKKFTITIKPESRAKSVQALGYYFGCIRVATAFEQLHLPYDPEQIRYELQKYKKEGKIQEKHLDAADDLLRLEFHYRYTRRFDGTVSRVPKKLADKDNGELLAFIEKINAYRSENGLPYLDPEVYKLKRDMGELL